MANNGESNMVLGFVVGAIVVALVVFIFFVVVPGQNADQGIDVTIETPTGPADATPEALPDNGAN